MIVNKTVSEHSDYIVYDVLDTKYKWVTSYINNTYDCVVYHMINTFKSSCNKILAHIDFKSRSVKSFAIITINKSNSQLEIIKLYGNKKKLVQYCISRFPELSVCVYTSTRTVSDMLTSMGFNTFTLTSHSNIGIRLFKPKIRHNIERSSVTFPISLDNVYELLNEYTKHPMYRTKLIMNREAVVNVFREQEDIKDHNEIGGKFDITGNELSLPKMALFKGKGLTVNVKPSPAVYHVHPSDFVTVDKINKFLLAWPSGMDYVAAIYNRFIQEIEPNMINFVSSKKGLFSYQMTPLFLFFMEKLDKRTQIKMAVIICVAVKYYFKIVEDVRSTHMHIHSSYTNHIITDMTTSIMDTKRMLCDSFNIEKVINILESDKKDINKLLKNTFNTYMFKNEKITSSRDETFYDTVKELKSLASGFNFPIIEIGNIMWDSIDLGEDKIDIFIYVKQNEMEYLNTQYNTKSVFFNKSFSLENSVL